MGTNFEVEIKYFADGGRIPPAFTCDGNNQSPEITWKNIPEKTKTLALILEDPDAPAQSADKKLFCHWIVYNIPANIYGLPGNFQKKREVEGGIRQGIGDYGKPGYFGPCPPRGDHRYYFKLFALDCVLDIKPDQADWHGIYAAMNGHIIANAEYMGRYKRP
jgi:Raf kinase inhibitor-like YbhB/YbcL family protein